MTNSKIFCAQWRWKEWSHLRAGPIPAELTWSAKELRAGRTVVIRSDKDIPAEAAAAAEQITSGRGHARSR
jgi:hypothetical protein